MGSPEAIAEASSDSDSDDAPLGKSIANRRLAVAGEAAVGKSSDLGAQLKGKLQSKLTGPKAMALLSCQRCGLGFDPKRDGPRCKHCTREEDDESGDEEDKASVPYATARSWEEELYGCCRGGEPFHIGGLFTFTAGLFARTNGQPINAE